MPLIRRHDAGAWYGGHIKVLPIWDEEIMLIFSM